jgi:hypothetical protein
LSRAMKGAPSRGRRPWRCRLAPPILSSQREGWISGRWPCASEAGGAGAAPQNACQRSADWTMPTFADLQSTMSNQGWVSPLVLSSMPATPLDSKSEGFGCTLHSSLPSAAGSYMVAQCLTFEVPLALSTCCAPLQEAVAPPSRRPAHQSIVDATALCPYATPQPPTGLYSLQPLRPVAPGA